ncbi:MAG: TonB-dependent receptor plug domain-containing protein, partial [Proteobacteria bacterium]|nr:TonB-dependent receptor plug domain-containing protein [Pseudomonadota bacterium]
MKLDRNELSKAVRMALSMGAVAAVGAVGTAYAQDQNATQGQNNNQSPQTLQTIVVTGSHIRRVDLETSSPVVAVSAQDIAKTGKMTLGDVVQKLPVITGGIETPNVNNGGGSGQTLVGLRGLGSSRTLILVDGQRVIGASAGAGSVDLNSIPAAAVERIEVLTDGASAVYGSDAIGGVINIILKSNYQGAQFQANYGISDRDDGARQGASFMFGQTSDKGSILAGVDYNKFDPVQQAGREFSRNAVSLVATSTTSSLALPGSGVTSIVGGSSYAARNKIRVPSDVLPANLQGCSYLSLNPDTATAGTSPVSLSDYHCFNNAQDKYNYAAVNLIMTPQERTNGFFKGVYHLSDNVDFYSTVYHQKSRSASQLAPSLVGTGPGFDTGFKISAQNYYNPFGVDFSGTGNTYTARLFPAGPRYFANQFVTDQMISGFKGNFNLGEQNWQWDVGYNYGHISNTVTNYGLPNQNILNEGA